MIQNERELRHEQVLRIAMQMMTAARTAPKGKGIDIIEVALVTGEDLKVLSDRMVALAEEQGMKFFLRDADNILSAECVVLIGTREQPQGLNCGHCGYATCAERPTGVPCAIVSVDVGIAIGAGTDVAMESADIVLMKSDLMDAVTAVQLSKAVIRNIKQNLFWAFFYNSIGIPLAAGLFFIPFALKLSPMFGAAAMSLSSVCVVSNALRLKFFKPKKAVGSAASQSTSAVHSLNVVQLEAPEPLTHTPNQTLNQISQEETKMKIIIEGMMCNHCTNFVKKTLNAIEGVSAEVSLEDKAAYVTLTQDVSKETLTAAIVDAGYEVVGIEE